MVRQLGLFETRLDFFIISTIYRYALQNKSVSVWKLAKEYNQKEISDLYGHTLHRFLTKRSRKIIFRLNIMTRKSLIICEKINNKRIYKINGERVLISRHRFPSGIANAIVVKSPQTELWTIYQT